MPLTSDYGDTKAEVLGFRWYPVMISRGGLALHIEYARVRTAHTAPLTGRDQDTNSAFLGFDVSF